MTTQKWKLVPVEPDGWRLVPYTPTVLMLERAEYAVNNRPQPSKYEPSATPAIIFWTAMLNYAPEAPTPAEAPADVARDAALYCAVQRACAELPEGWEIRIELERSAGTVSLVNPDGEDVDYPSDHEYMASDINDAIDSAIAAEKGGAK